MATVVFYTFAIFLVLASVFVVGLRNPVHSVLFLIFAFFNAAGLMVLLGAEFIAMTLVIVYVGAVAVLFLFVVMMLNINISEIKQGFLKSLPLGLFLATLIFIQISLALLDQGNVFAKSGTSAGKIVEVNNTLAIGKVLYTDYIFVFQGCGVILLIAMIGAIVLTLTHNRSVKRQNISKQLLRDKESSVELIDVKSGEGVKL